VKFQLGFYRGTIENVNGRSQDRLEPERNSPGRSAEEFKASQYMCISVTCYLQ
jgi:hypothetical protein